MHCNMSSKCTANIIETVALGLSFHQGRFIIIYVTQDAAHQIIRAVYLSVT